MIMLKTSVACIRYDRLFFFRKKVSQACLSLLLRSGWYWMINLFIISLYSLTSMLPMLKRKSLSLPFVKITNSSYSWLLQSKCNLPLYPLDTEVHVEFCNACVSLFLPLCHTTQSSLLWFSLYNSAGHFFLLAYRCHWVKHLTTC